MATTLLTSGITMGSSTLSPSGTAPSYTSRAWVNFNGSGTVSIREDGNVSSITDNGTGKFTVNFTTAMSDANYAVSCASGGSGSGNREGCQVVFGTITTSSVRVTPHTSSVSLFDSSNIFVSIFR